MKIPLGPRITCLGLIVLAALASVPAHAQLRGTLVVTITDTPDPAPTLGQVTYVVTVKNNGSTRASSVAVSIPLPAGTQFVKCVASNKVPCTETAGTVNATLGTLKAHAAVRVTLVLVVPLVTETSTITLSARANGSSVTDGTGHQTTTILPATTPVVFLPSNRAGTVSCGDVLGPATFGADTTMQFLAGLGCASSAAALTIQAAGKTIDLHKFKIVGATLPGNLGNVGVKINAVNVRLTGGSTSGSSGIEYFDFGVKDIGGSAGLVVDKIRIFRARSVGIRTVSDNVTLSNLLVDRTVFTKGATTDSPGAVGIHASGITHISNAVSRRNTVFGIWADGTTSVPNTRGVTIDGNTSTMRVEQNAGIGIQLDGGPHAVKDTLVTGDGISGTSTDGVVIGPTGTGITLDGVVVKAHGGNGIVTNGVGTVISRSSVDNTVGLDGFVSAGGGTVLNGNDSQALGDGFVISGPDATLTSNTATAAGDGFVLSGANASLANNRAIGNGGRGFVVQAGGGSYNTNVAQLNVGDGFSIAGAGNTFLSDSSEQNGGVGFNVAGTSNQFKNNAAQLNGGAEWVLSPGNLDNTGNKLNGSTFSFTTAGGTFD